MARFFVQLTDLLSSLFLLTCACSIFGAFYEGTITGNAAWVGWVFAIPALWLGGRHAVGYWNGYDYRKAPKEATPCQSQK